MDLEPESVSGQEIPHAGDVPELCGGGGMEPAQGVRSCDYHVTIT